MLTNKESSCLKLKIPHGSKIIIIRFISNYGQINIFKKKCQSRC